ncbi:hypothetical protein MBH78_10685 [Oceanimonas sp. NS1]|nr:hypothetical protein [Oceanimonas sp. NS1]
MALGAILGLFLACGYRSAGVRRLAAGLRAVHELFWALLFMQLLGLSALAGVLAIALPYAGTFAKIYGELFEEADPAPEQALPAGLGRLSRLVYLQLPLCWRQMATYTGYRLGAAFAARRCWALSACPPWAITWNPCCARVITMRPPPFSMPWC